MTPEPQQIAEEIRDERGPDRVMEVQRARMWDRDAREWTRYELAREVHHYRRTSAVSVSEGGTDV